MALCIKNTLKSSKDQDFIKNWIQHRFLADSSAHNLSVKTPALHLKTMKSFIQWNSYLKLSHDIGRNFNSIANFHHLAVNILNYDVGGKVMNIDTRNYARRRQKPPDLDTHMGSIREIYEKERLDKEMARLRKKGAMKDIKVKTPEGVISEKDI